MITCTVHERESDEPDVTARADRIVFVREGIAWWAFLFPVIWLLYHRLWLVLLLFLAVIFALTGLVSLLDWPESLGGVPTMLASFLLALEGNDLRRWTLTRKGYAQVDVTTGRDRQECEQRFFEDWLPAQRDGDSRRLPVLQAASGRSRGDGNGGDDVIGLFPEAGR